MRKPGIRVLAAICTALIIACSMMAGDSVHAYKDTASPLNITVTFGITDSAKYGRYLPLHILVKNFGDDVSGMLQIFAPEEDEENYLYETELVLAAGDSEEKVFYIPLSYGMEALFLRILNDGKDVLYKDTILLNAPKDSTDINLGVLSADHDTASYFNGVSLNDYMDTYLRVTGLTGELMPEEVLELDMLDIIIADDSYEGLTEVQKETVVSWVFSGGVLIFEKQSGSYEKDGGIESSEAAGEGLIIHTGFSMSDLMNYCEDMGSRSEAGNFFNRALTENRLMNLESEIYSNSMPDYWSVYSMVNSVPPGKIPSVAKYVLVLLAYILLIGPGLYLFLKKRHKPDVQRALIAAFAVLFCGIIFAISSDTRFQNSFVNYGTIVEENRDRVCETSYFSLRSPDNRNYKVKLKEGYSLIAIAGSNRESFSYGMERVIPREDYDYNVGIRYAGEGDEIRIRDMVAFSPNTFKAARSYAIEGEATVSGELSVFKDQVGGRLINNTEEPLRNVTVVLYGQIIEIGSMEPKEEVDLSNYVIRDCASEYPYNTSRKIAGFYENLKNKVGQAEYTEVIQKAQIVQYYLDEFFSQKTDTARVIAYRDTEEPAQFLADDSTSGYGRTLYATEIPISFEKDGLIYQPYLKEDPVVLDGFYDGSSIAMSSSSAVTLEISLNEALEDLVELCFRDGVTDKDYSYDYRTEFVGSCYFYNFETGRYDKMDLQKAYQRAELAPYINDSNSLQVRYVQEKSGDSRSSVALPIISLVRRAG